MSMNFKDRLEHEYPVPFVASIFGDPTLTDIEGFIEMCLDDLQSDLEIYESIQATGLNTILPEGTRAVTSVKFNQEFQGNRFVKFTFDKERLMCSVRYTPCTITYKRAVKLEDLETLKGSRLQFIKAYILEKMLSKEISYLTAVNLETTEGSIDVAALEAARLKNETLYKEYKEDIMIYSGS